MTTWPDAPPVRAGSAGRPAVVLAVRSLGSLFLVGMGRGWLARRSEVAGRRGSPGSGRAGAPTHPARSAAAATAARRPPPAQSAAQSGHSAASGAVSVRSSRSEPSGPRALAGPTGRPLRVGGAAGMRWPASPADASLAPGRAADRPQGGPADHDRGRGVAATEMITPAEPSHTTPAHWLRTRGFPTPTMVLRRKGPRCGVRIG